MYKSTPIERPSYRDNKWADTPAGKQRPGTDQPAHYLTDNGEMTFLDDGDKLQWEADQEDIDRHWYHMDEGHNDDYNPCSGMEEYAARKEATVKRIPKVG